MNGWVIVFVVLFFVIIITVSYIGIKAEQKEKYQREQVSSYSFCFLNVEKLYKQFAKESVSKKFNREYKKIYTKQGAETVAYKKSVNEYCRIFREILFDDKDNLRDVYCEKFSGMTNGEFEIALRTELQNILDGNPLYHQTNINTPPTTRERTVTLSQRQRIMRRDNFTCQLCGARGTGARPVSGTAELRVDHKLPFSKGGTDDDSNLWTLCFECNSGKSDKYDDSLM